MEDCEGTMSKEIVLTEVVEPPKDFSQQHDESKKDVEDIQTLQELPDELDVLFDTSESSLTSPAEEPDIDALIQDTLSDDTPLETTSLFEDTPNTTLPETISEESTQSSEEHETTKSALDKLDNLDAMIDTMMSAPSTVESTLVEKIEALDQRIAVLESSPAELKGEFSLQDVYERTIHLEGQFSILQTTISEIQDHLQALLSLPKKVNDIEKQIEPLLISPPSPEEHVSAIEQIEQRIEKFESSIGEMQQSLDSFHSIQNRLDTFESQLSSSLEKETSSSQFESTILGKLEQLEHTVDSILEKQRTIEESTSIQAIHEALLPSIEKEAILAASRIIKEELQTILTWK